MNALLRRVLALACTAAVAGCASTPPERFWQLPMPSAPALAAGSASGSATGAAGTIVVGPVGLPELFDRPQLVTGGAGVELQVWESHRWAEPLRQNLGRALAARLAVELAPAPVLAWPLAPGGEPALRVGINLLRFDAVLGRGVDDEVQWTVRRLSDNALRSGRTALRQPSAGPGHEGLVAAHGAVLDAVARDIAQAIRDWPAPEPRR